MHRARHLREHQLLDCYLAIREGEPVNPLLGEHLTDCAECATRYADLTRFMDAVRADGDAEVDTLFSAERLRAQQREIARKIEHVARPARVISFPGQAVPRTLVGSASRMAPRWAAAAAAAGLFIGIAVGASYEWDSRATVAARYATTREPADRANRAAANPSARPALVSDHSEDDAFLSELELALDRPRTRELMAVDAFTPHVRETR
jgi:anti-sigma factor RsiW